MKDIVGMTLSLLCMAHCLLLPLLLTLIPLSLPLVENEFLHLTLVGFVTIVSVPLLVFRGNQKTLTLGILGTGFLATALLQHHGMGEKLFTVIGSLAILIGHLVRRKLLPGLDESLPETIDLTTGLHDQRCSSKLNDKNPGENHCAKEYI